MPDPTHLTPTSSSRNRVTTAPNAPARPTAPIRSRPISVSVLNHPLNQLSNGNLIIR